MLQTALTLLQSPVHAHLEVRFALACIAYAVVMIHSILTVSFPAA
jgi:hypothetical protein